MKRNHTGIFIHKNKKPDIQIFKKKPGSLISLPAPANLLSKERPLVKENISKPLK